MVWNRYFVLTLARLQLTLICLVAGLCAGTAQVLRPAFYYGPLPVPQELNSYDTWVVEPDEIQDRHFIETNRERLFAYVSVCEVDPGRPWLAKLPKSWIRGENKTWQSPLIDQSAPGWQAFFVNEVIEPLWQRGFRHFFLDTLDSYQLFAKTPEETKRQEEGLIATIRALKARHPDARLIVNRGFEIMPRIKSYVYAVVAESLFQSWDNDTKHYVPVEKEEREWLLGELRKVRDELGLPVIVIDYAPPRDRKGALEIASRIKSLGFIPWVTDGALREGGVGIVDVSRD